MKNTSRFLSSVLTTMVAANAIVLPHMALAQATGPAPSSLPERIDIDVTYIEATPEALEVLGATLIKFPGDSGPYTRYQMNADNLPVTLGSLKNNRKFKVYRTSHVSTKPNVIGTDRLNNKPLYKDAKSGQWLRPVPGTTVTPTLSKAAPYTLTLALQPGAILKRLETGKDVKEENLGGTQTLIQDPKKPIMLTGLDSNIVSGLQGANPVPLVAIIQTSVVYPTQATPLKQTN